MHAALGRHLEKLLDYHLWAHERILEAVAPLDEAARAMKYDLLVRILENDALTRDLAIPQLARLGELLGRMKRQQTLLSAYGYQAPEE
ncbi:MAG: flagellar protein FliT [Achromobacter sp.]|nr:flagellar protein FliT [Achromobacter sp.]